MKPFCAIVLCIISGILGFFIGAMLQDPGSYVVAFVNMAMGGCIIYTINKNFEQLQKGRKEDSKCDNT